MRTIKSHNLELFVEECNKIVLNSADNKRYIEEDVNETLAFGHYEIPHSSPKSILPEILVDPTISMDEKHFVVSYKRSTESEKEDIPDPGFLSSDTPDDEQVYSPPKRARKNPFIMFEAQEA